ncbi:MAG: hypothetical protein FWC16_01110 [Defluviitaleaceae bacterium]|nr:hypothetical protein [Defluviitaleaceae bacterium]MCL2273503.1 hypothetical protein [Defluviitaleaceae bacterium]
MKKYTLVENDAPDREVTRFKWQTGIDNNAIITWQWPKNPDVKYMLAAVTEEDPEDPLEWLMQDPAAHTVVTRNLAAHYELPIGETPKRFIFAPAYLHKKDVAIYGPALVTDLLYAKVHATVRITNRPILLSPYKRVGFTLRFSQPHGAEIGQHALRYALYEFSRLIGTYALDATLMAGGYMHIKKTQHIRFMIDEKYEHLIALK